MSPQLQNQITRFNDKSVVIDLIRSQKILESKLEIAEKKLAILQQDCSKETLEKCRQIDEIEHYYPEVQELHIAY